MSGSEPRLIMMARVPAYGRVKSRLAKHVGKPRALQAHVELLKRNVLVAAAAAESAGLLFELHFAGEAPGPFFTEMARLSSAALVPQTEGDIGARMLAAAQRQTGPSLIIGSDCGSMTKHYLQDAAARLAGTQVVLGTAEDGGYVLIGQEQAFPQLFQGITWGTETVAAQTRKQAKHARLELVELAPLWDIDTVEDWRRYARGSKVSICS